MLAIDKQKVEARKAELENTRKVLKDKFIGIDTIIDDLLDYIQVWYLLPEILNRPVVVNLWGMTGVGKTDLIRKMVSSLNFQDRFVEIELSNVDSTSYSSSVAQVLQNNELANEQPSIILFDEIQRFNTIDGEGKAMTQTKYMDFWELLSDGRLSKKSKDDLDWYLMNYYGKKKEADTRTRNGETLTENEKNPTLSVWEARELRKVLNLNETLEELSSLRESDMIELIMKAKSKKKIYEPVNYSKALIIISGNLDEAFRMAGETSETDIDADIFHAFTKKITLVDVKNSLSRKFRPEQVARFGNIHLIYNSLRKHDFELLISREIERIVNQTKTMLGIDLIIDATVNELIYKNGVFPVQGVRPVFSSIVDILESNLSKFIYEALINDNTKIHVSYNNAAKKLTGKIDNKVVEIAYTGRIDKIRESNELDSVANISVHESGHAVAYMALIGLAPLQLKSRIANSYAAGFTFPHSIHETRENLINKIKIYLAGGVAEELVFGVNNASIGRSADRETATQMAIEFVRKYGFDEEFQANYSLDSYPFQMDKFVTDSDIEKMMSRLVFDTKELLNKHLPLLTGLSQELSKAGTLEPLTIQTIAKQYNLVVDSKEEGYFVINSYNATLFK
jgi:SpoVK/Ycf46/Vps4 family AAA+-type ATPase